MIGNVRGTWALGAPEIRRPSPERTSSSSTETRSPGSLRSSEILTSSWTLRQRWLDPGLYDRDELKEIAHPEAAGKSGKGRDRAHLLDELRHASLLGHFCDPGRSHSGSRLEALRVGLPMPTPSVHFSALQLLGYEIAQSPLDVLILCPYDSVERERK